jgi:hypothetical protein
MLFDWLVTSQVVPMNPARGGASRRRGPIRMPCAWFEQLAQHDGLADLFDEDCGSNTPFAAVAPPDPNGNVFDVCS